MNDKDLSRWRKGQNIDPIGSIHMTHNKVELTCSNQLAQRVGSTEKAPKRSKTRNKMVSLQIMQRQT